MATKKASAGKERASEEGTRWRLAVLNRMEGWVREAGHPVDSVTKRVLMRKLDKLQLLIGMLQGDLLAHLPRPGARLTRSIYDSEIPMAPDEAAALIVWEAAPANFLARKLLLKTRFEDYEDLKINMDWFYRPLEEPRDASIDRRWAHRSVIQPWPPG